MSPFYLLLGFVGRDNPKVTIKYGCQKSLLEDSRELRFRTILVANVTSAED